MIQLFVGLLPHGRPRLETKAGELTHTAPGICELYVNTSWEQLYCMLTRRSPVFSFLAGHVSDLRREFRVHLPAHSGFNIEKSWEIYRQEKTKKTCKAQTIIDLVSTKLILWDVTSPCLECPLDAATLRLWLGLNLSHLQSAVVATCFGKACLQLFDSVKSRKRLTQANGDRWTSKFTRTVCCKKHSHIHS